MSPGICRGIVMPITVMSYNTFSCRRFDTHKFDFDSFVEVIRRHNADIVGLNEIRGKGMDEGYQAQAKLLAEKLGYYYYFAKAIDIDGVNPYGNAVLSKFPITMAETIMIPDPVSPAYDGYYETRCLLKARIDVYGGIDVCVAHFGLNPDEQKNAVDVALKNINEEKCILMGDFNVEPQDQVLAHIRDRLYDTAELFTRDLKSFPSNIPKVKIDYIFTSRDFIVLSADIPADVVSDHRPHIAVIDGLANGR